MSNNKTNLPTNLLSLIETHNGFKPKRETTAKHGTTRKTVKSQLLELPDPKNGLHYRATSRPVNGVKVPVITVKYLDETQKSGWNKKEFTLVSQDLQEKWKGILANLEGENIIKDETITTWVETGKLPTDRD